jgi:hypothetical protein
MKTMVYGMLIALTFVGAAVAKDDRRVPAPDEPPTVYDTPDADQVQRALTECLVKETLVKWIFAVVSHHPEVKPMVTMTPKQEEQIARAAGGVFESLIADECASEIRVAMARSGDQAIGQSFQFLGETAMGSLVEHPEVRAAVNELSKYTDSKRIERALKGD